MGLDKEIKAGALKLAMQIELGKIDTRVVLHYIRKDVETWKPILEFLEKVNNLGATTIDRLYLESRFLRS